MMSLKMEAGKRVWAVPDKGGTDIQILGIFKCYPIFEYAFAYLNIRYYSLYVENKHTVAYKLFSEEHGELKARNKHNTLQYLS